MPPSATMSGVPTDRDRDMRMKRIRRLSSLMAMACLATCGLLAAAMLIYWVTTPASTLYNQAGLPNASATDLDWLTRLVAFGIAMIPLGALIYGLLNARRCFKAFAAGDIFLAEPVRRLRTFSIAIAASALLKPIAGAALSVLLSFRNASQTKTLALNIGSDTLIALIFAGTVAVIAWVMAEALDIADENKQFV